MLKASFRILFGFVLACFAAGLTTVLFAVPPQQVIASDPDQLAQVAEWTSLVATHSAVFAAPFALLGIVIGEWQQVRSFLYYVFLGVAIAGAGFAAQYVGETNVSGTILNSYAGGAFAASGLIAGLVYWLFAGRWAGRNGDGEPAARSATSVPTTRASDPGPRTPLPPQATIKS